MLNFYVLLAIRFLNMLRKRNKKIMILIIMTQLVFFFFLTHWLLLKKKKNRKDVFMPVATSHLIIKISTLCYLGTGHLSLIVVVIPVWFCFVKHPLLQDGCGQNIYY